MLWHKKISIGTKLAHFWHTIGVNIHLRRKSAYYDYDVYADGVYSLVWLDGDLRRLWEASDLDGNLRVYCFAWQQDFVRIFLGEDVEIVIADFDKVEKLLFNKYAVE